MRAKRDKVFADIATHGKGTMGWSFSIKIAYSLKSDKPSLDLTAHEYERLTNNNLMLA